MYNEIKSIKEPTEEDCYLGIIRAYQREVDNLQQENKQLKEELENKKKMYWQNLASMRGLILTELEEWLKEEKERYYGEVGIHQKLLIEKVLDKIQELKEKYK